MGIEQLLKFLSLIAGRPAVGFTGSVYSGAAIAGKIAPAVYVSGSAVVVDASAGNVLVVPVNDAVAFTIGAPINPPLAGFTQDLTIVIQNVSGGALGVGTFAALYKMSTNTAPAIANGFSRSFRFYWNGTNWVEQFATAADVAN